MTIEPARSNPLRRTEGVESPAWSWDSHLGRGELPHYNDIECGSRADRPEQTVSRGFTLAYGEFTLETVEGLLGVTPQETDLFPNLPAAPVPDWLPGWLCGGRGWP